MRSAMLFFLLGFARLGIAQPQPLLKLEAATDRELYLAESRNKIYLEVKVGVSPQPASAPTVQSARNVAFVLDRSGSMEGASLQSLRPAVSHAINALSPQDIVSVILFGSEVETLIEAKRRDQLDNVDTLLAQIEPAGGSALYDALNQAAAQLRRLAGPATSNHLILVTDGPPTKGPREFDDFSHLTEVFAQENITLSTIGLGPDFNEDLLAAMARIGMGHFRYAEGPEKLIDAVQAEIAPFRTLVARDATLTVEFNSQSEKVEPYGWTPSTVKNATLTYHFPYIFADQPLRILCSVTAVTRRFTHKLGTVRLSWKELVDGSTHETVKALSLTLDSSEESVRLAARPSVIRTAVNALISEGLEDAILQIDKGDSRRALRVLRRARNEAYNFNYELDDAEITARIRILEHYLTEADSRGMTPLDRKILRSGLFGQFDSPTADDASDR